MAYSKLPIDEEPDAPLNRKAALFESLSPHLNTINFIFAPMIKNRTYRILLLAPLAAAFLLSACENREIEEMEIDFGYEYYPLEIGRSWTYLVDSVVYQPGIGRVEKDSSRSYLRETIVDTTTALDGELQYIVERYYRPDDQTPWRVAKVFTRSRSETQAFQTEDNLRFIKMVFPLEPGKTWDGNVHFDETREFLVGGEYVAIYRDWDYAVALMNETIEIHGRTYSNVTAIQQANYTEDNTRFRTAQEKYAPEVGLIYREWFIADSKCSSCASIPWEDRAEEGFYLQQTLISYE